MFSYRYIDIFSDLKINLLNKAVDQFIEENSTSFVMLNMWIVWGNLVLHFRIPAYVIIDSYDHKGNDLFD